MPDLGLTCYLIQIIAVAQNPAAPSVFQCNLFHVLLAGASCVDNDTTLAK